MGVELSRCHVVWFSKAQGRVVKASKVSTTHVSSSGGGGVMHGRSGYIAVPTISSGRIDQTEFFLQDIDGREVGFTLPLGTLHLREGHEVSVVWRSAAGKSEGPYSVVCNHTVGESADLISDLAVMHAFGIKAWLNKKYFWPTWRWTALIIAILGAVFGGLVAPSQHAAIVVRFIYGGVILGAIGVVLAYPIAIFICLSPFGRNCDVTIQE